MSSVPFKSVQSKGSSVPPSPLSNSLANAPLANTLLNSGSTRVESKGAGGPVSDAVSDVLESPKPPVAALKAKPVVSPTQRLSSANTVPNPNGLQGGLPHAALVVKGSQAEAGRNLALGIICTLALVPVGGIAFWSAPRESFVALSTAVLLGLALFLAIQFRVLVQRNGVFFLLSACLAISLSVPIGVRLVSAGSEWAQTFAEFNRQQSVSPVSSGRVPSGSQVSSKVSAERVGGAAQGGGEGSAQSQPADEQGSSRHATPAPVENSGAAKTAVPEVDPYADEDPSQRITRLAKDEAIRRYPALQTTGTKEHQVYLDAYNELARSRKFDFFKDPKWPLKLADIVGTREGWGRADSRGPMKANGTAPVVAVLPGSEFSLEGQNSSMMARTANGMENSPVASASPSSEPITGGARGVASPSPLSAEEVETNKSIAEARRRYPAVGREGSPENKAYLEAYQDLDSRKTDFFERSDWPLRLVELVAKQEGWKRVDASPAPGKASGVKITDTKELPLPQ